MVITVAMHAAGFAVLLRAIVRSHALDRSGFRFVYPSLIILTCWLILIHLLEVSVWGVATAISCCPSRGGCSHRLRH